MKIRSVYRAFHKELLESELFGHRAGAFTGAFKDKKGLIEEANGGTLFLDEMGEMPVDLQSKLLRVLETGEFIKAWRYKIGKGKCAHYCSHQQKLTEGSK